MSVENIDAVSPSGGFLEQTGNISETSEKARKEEQEDSPQAVASTPVAVTASEVPAPIESEDPLNARMTGWADKLDENALLSAFTLDDVPFLAFILAVSSSSLSTRGHTDRLSGTAAGHIPLWLDSVRSTEIQAVRNRICDDFKTGGVVITRRWISSVQASIAESLSMSSEVSGRSLIPDETLRIRRDFEKDGEMSDIEAFWLILEHVRVVFPSAISFVSGNENANKKSTLLTLSPSIIRSFGARKVYDSLNAGLRSILPDEKFLSSLPCDGTWFDSLLMAAQSEQKDGIQIPLFAVYLFRLEHAFREAYQASVAASVAEGGDEQPVAQSGDRQSTDMSLDSHAFVASLTERLKELETSEIDGEEIRNITHDLAKACALGGTDVKSIRLADLLLTPLTLVCRSMETEGIGSLAAVDDIISTALERFKAVRGVKKVDDAVQGKSNGSARQNQDNQQQKENTPKKKKKKRPKKKQGKARAAEQSKPENKTTSAIDQSTDTIGGSANNSTGGMNGSVPDSEDDNAISKAPIADAPAPVVHEHLRESEHGNDAPKQMEPKEAVSNHVDAAPSDAPAVQAGEESHDDGDAWETVEVKPRNQRRRGLDRSNTMSSRTSTGASSGANESGNKKSKEKRTSATRRKTATRKMVRDILYNVVDSVEVESSRKQKVVMAAPVSSENRWKQGPPLPGANKSNPAAASLAASTAKTLRDIVMKTNPAANADHTTDKSQQQHVGENAKQSLGDLEQAKKQAPDSPIKRPLSSSSEATKKGHQTPKSPAKRHEPVSDGSKKTSLERALPKPTPQGESISKSSPSKWVKGKSAALADQNTAPTYQETVSAMSGTSNRLSDRPVAKTNQVEPAKSDTSTGDTAEAPQNRDRAASPVDKESTSGPPLLTFVSPENANSATSSVASSLEVPHTSRRHHHSTSTPDAADVGYHLLDVCDRLTRDMGLFMNSREQAINIRRRERGAVLTALQESLSKVWPGMCRPEMYGSCATLLDLPSSDLDVVVVGLDHSEMLIAHEMAAAAQQKSKRRESSNKKHRRAGSKDGSVADEDTNSAHSHPAPPSPPTHSPHVHPGGYVALPMYRNSERVKQLAMQIDGQPWAVKVKSLPNASVPVIKILADPSKLPGLATGVEWPSPITDSDVEDETQSGAAAGDALGGPAHQTPSQNLYEPWRGSDIMNGLISLDITFEGPEHGGLGSTDFSVHIVNEACQEAEAPPESTPFVQCLMVLKELLVQRKLNEPYSGGLSSYALLLLLLALVRERALIRQEIERVECQRQAMTNVDVATYAGALAGAATNESAEGSVRQAQQVTAAEENNTAPSSVPAGSMTHSNSWANIAKKPSSTPTPSVSSEKPAIEQSNDAVKPKLDRPASFADAVARRSNAPGTSDAEGEGGGNTFDNQATRRERETPAPGDSSAAASVLKDPVDPNSIGVTSFYPQGFDDVIEVLCTGETTAGKLLMHFLLYYGQYFDAQATAIDISGKHERVYMGHSYSPYSYLSPYIPRRAPETIDPHTGMLVVDHIVIYDPLEGAEYNNVARRCFAWQQVKWIFAQSYATLSSAVERSSSPPASPTAPIAADEAPVGQEMASGDLMDPSSPLLRCLLSF